MTDQEAQQQQEEQQQIEYSLARDWRCCYCGTPMNPGCPHPSTFECCGEVGHVERLNDQGHWEYGYE